MWQVYTKHVKAVQLVHALIDTATPELVDTSLEEALVRHFLKSRSIQDGRYMLYALRWHCALTNAQLCKSPLSLLGYDRARRSAASDPATWESVLLSAHQCDLATASRQSNSDHTWWSEICLLLLQVHIASPSPLDLSLNR